MKIRPPSIDCQAWSRIQERGSCNFGFALGFGFFKLAGQEQARTIAILLDGQDGVGLGDSSAIYHKVNISVGCGQYQHIFYMRNTAVQTARDLSYVIAHTMQFQGRIQDPSATPLGLMNEGGVLG